MRWYNRIFDAVGHRRLMTREEFSQQVAGELIAQKKTIVREREYERLKEVAAAANALIIAWNGGRGTKASLRPVVDRLRKEVTEYKVAVAVANAPAPRPITPPSTIAHEEVLMEIT